MNNTTKYSGMNSLRWIWWGVNYPYTTQRREAWDVSYAKALQERNRQHRQRAQDFYNIIRSGTCTTEALTSFIGDRA